MIEFLSNNKHIIPLIALVLSSLIYVFIIWRSRNKFQLKKEVLLDHAVIFCVLSIICARIIFIFQNLGEFSSRSWSIYPYYFDPGAQRVWLEQMPWILFKFWDGSINPSGMFLGGIISTLIFVRRNNLPADFYSLAIKALCVSQIILVISFFVAVSYWGKPTDLVIGVKYTALDDRFRVPLQFIEILVLTGVLFFLVYLQNTKKLKGNFGIYLFIIGWLEIIIDFFKDKSETISNRVSAIQIAYLLFVIVGILIFLLSGPKGEDLPAYGDRGPQKAKVIVGGDVSRIPRERGKYASSFRTGYSTYQKPRPNLMEVIKRKFHQIKNSFSRKKRA